jgi:hypothetical protein
MYSEIGEKRTRHIRDLVSKQDINKALEARIESWKRLY